jgi:hypothetical protein
MKPLRRIKFLFKQTQRTSLSKPMKSAAAFKQLKGIIKTE